MVQFNRRRVVRGRRLGGRPQRPSAPLPPIDVDSRNSEASTEFSVDAVEAEIPKPPKARSSDSTVELKSLLSKSDAGDETEAAAPSIDAPLPPSRMQFACPCGAVLVATPEMYDRNTRCGMCQTVFLVNLVYDAESKSHEIVPFRVNPDSKH